MPAFVVIDGTIVNLGANLEITALTPGGLLVPPDRRCSIATGLRI
jgi:hypothetical protein